MRLLATLLALELAATGCATTTGRYAAATSAVASTVVLGTIIKANSEPQSSSEAPPLSVYLVGAALLVALVSGGIAIGAEATASDPIVVAQRSNGAPGMCDPRAAQLTSEAQRAARLGQCGAVRSFGERVRELDPGCYAVEFVAIRCDQSP